MCFIYNKNGKPSYVRACYRTGKAGTHVPIEAAVWADNGCLKRLAGSRGLKANASEPTCRRCGQPMIVCRDRCF